MSPFWLKNMYRSCTAHFNTNITQQLELAKGTTFSCFDDKIAIYYLKCTYTRIGVITNRRLLNQATETRKLDGSYIFTYFLGRRV